MSIRRLTTIAPLVTVLLLAVLAAPGCDDPSSSTNSGGAGGGGDSAQPAIDSYIIVQIRRDALGAAGAPLAPMSGPVGGAELAVGGKLRRLNADWVVVESGGREIWIPRSVVLLIDVQKPAE
jgi:hypothetical protein